MELDFAEFEPLMGVTPFRLLSVHPTEPLVALQVYGIRQAPDAHTEGEFSSANMRSAIWDRETHQLVTVPENTVALTWNVDGTQIGLVREYYIALEDREEGGFSSYDYTWERLSWPDQKLLSSCDVVFCTGWPESITFSPEGDLVVVQWFGVNKSGFEFIEQTRWHGDVQREDTGLPSIDYETELFEADEDEDGRFFVYTSLVTLPVFNADGRYFVFGWQPRQHWWTDIPDDVYVEGDLPVKIGACQVGNMQIVDWQTLTTRTLPIWVNLPRGWQPTDNGERSNELFAEPVFIDNEHFQFRLPTGEMAMYSVEE